MCLNLEIVLVGLAEEKTVFPATSTSVPCSISFAAFPKSTPPSTSTINDAFLSDNHFSKL